MALAGQLGLEINLVNLPCPTELDRVDYALFSESLGRFVVEVRAEDTATFEAALVELPFAQIGRVREDQLVHMTDFDGKLVIETDLTAIDHAWRGHLHTEK